MYKYMHTFYVISIHMCMYVCIFIYTHTHINIYPYIYKYICIYWIRKFNVFYVSRIYIPFIFILGAAFSPSTKCKF